MTELISMNEHIAYIEKDDVFTNSKIVAECAEVKHHAVQQLLQNHKSDFEEFGKLRFTHLKCENPTGGRPEKIYLLNEQQATLLLTYLKNTEPVRKFKKALVHQFFSLREQLQIIRSARSDFPVLTAHISALHEKPQPYHFSNECDLINRIVTGMTAKQFRAEHGIPKGESIRPHLTKEQIHLLDTLQKVDMGLLIAEPDYQQRRIRLEWYAQNVYKPAK